jgi:hypothetical protein
VYAVIPKSGKKNSQFKPFQIRGTQPVLLRRSKIDTVNTSHGIVTGAVISEGKYSYTLSELKLSLSIQKSFIEFRKISMHKGVRCNVFYNLGN